MFNLHTHSFYCHHGEGTIDEYVEEAEAKGLSFLGFSEHNPFPDDILMGKGNRMHYTSRFLYENDVRKAKAHSSIPIFLGYECDWWPGREAYIRELSETTDYLICGVHFVEGLDGTPKATMLHDIHEKGVLSAYVDKFIEALSSGLFLFGAHPDCFMYRKESFGVEDRAASKAILEAALDLDIALEVNANGIAKTHARNYPFYPYPRREFWEMAAEYGVKTVINSDAHTVENLTKYLGEAYGFAKELGLKLVEPQIVEGKLFL